MCITQIEEFTASEQLAWDHVSKGRGDGSDNPPETKAMKEEELMKSFIKSRISDDLRCKVHNDTMNRRRIQRKMIERAGGVIKCENSMNANLSGKFINTSTSIGVGSGSGTFDEPGLAKKRKTPPQNDFDISDDDPLNLWQEPGRSQCSSKKSQDSSKSVRKTPPQNDSESSDEDVRKSGRSQSSYKKSQDSSKKSEDSSMQEEPRQQQEKPIQRRQSTSNKSQARAVKGQKTQARMPIRKSARNRSRNK